jgi:hypothetical protein
MHAVKLLPAPKGILYSYTHSKRTILLLVVMLFPFCAIHVQGQKRSENKKTPVEPKPVQFPVSSAVKNSTITYQLIQGNDHTWGYNILLDNRIIIKQPTPPGMFGNNGFATKKGAEDVAKLVISKMKKGEVAPTITIDEMKKLKAI